MVRLLHINCSPRSANSHSLAVAEQFLTAFRQERPDAEVDTWDLFTSPLPAFGVDAAEAKMATFFGQDQTPHQQSAWTSARAVFDRFAAADRYLFNVPMWNHGVPYVLKQWIDIITQPGWAFGFDPAAGYTGLLQDKRATVIYSSGVYAENRPPAFGTDFLSPYLDDWLSFVGISDRDEIKLFGQVLDPDACATRDLAMKRARQIAAHG